MIESAKAVRKDVIHHMNVVIYFQIGNERSLFMRTW
jgi:hypothetical protein